MTQIHIISPGDYIMDPKQALSKSIGQINDWMCQHCLHLRRQKLGSLFSEPRNNAYESMFIFNAWVMLKTATQGPVTLTQI